ncbi:hypothetical protein [Actinopolymorpha alba]|uniref:hypothetical protein n=1 Tax=Actinopolymorpha alba TaxID=533267 RepID=UPI00035EC71A|nr:hypothetical protein [Actinopolymorpha alba]
MEQTQEQKVQAVVAAWTDKTDVPIGQEARRDMLVNTWPELAEALQALAPVDYEPIASADELAEQVRKHATVMIQNVYGGAVPVEQSGE